jgi:outer membrane receptor for ferrienterochelin and colicin
MFGNESFTISDIDLETLNTELKKISISFLNFQPNWIIKLQNQINYKNWTILFNHQWLSKRKISLSESTNYLGDSTALPSYYHLDMHINFQTTKNSLISLAINNVFNTKFAGIRANDTQDALVYNPQPLRNWYIRATYYLD